MKYDEDIERFDLICSLGFIKHLYFILVEKL